jgi:hypothetical protein
MGEALGIIAGRGTVEAEVSMENPTEEEIRAMTNREFAALIHFQAAETERTMQRDEILDAKSDRWRSSNP